MTKEEQEAARELHRAAAAYADRRLDETLEYLRGDDATKHRIATKWMDDEIAKPLTHMRIVGIGGRV